MTDRNDLRRMLDELADETPKVSTREWLSGTRHKVRVRRRARWAGATAATALVVAATAAVVPRAIDETDSRPVPVEPVSKPDGRDGWPFAATMDTDRVIAARRNDRGESEFVWTTQIKRLPGTIHMQFCRLPEEPRPGEPRVRIGLTINGRPTLGWPCKYRADYPPVHGSLVTQDLSRDLRETYHVEPNEPFTVEMWLEREGQRVEVDSAAFGFALASCDVASEGSDNIPSGGVPGCDSVNFPGLDPSVGGRNLTRAP